MFRFQITPRPSWLRPPRCGSVFHARTSDRKSTRLNSSHSQISYAVFCLKKKKTNAISLAALTHEKLCGKHIAVVVVRTMLVIIAVSCALVRGASTSVIPYGFDVDETHVH